MPMIDMPVRELEAYKGSNIKPADYDAYWARALRELDALDFKPELIPSSFKSGIADCFDLYFTSTGAARIHAKLLIPKAASKQNKAPAVLQFHGYSGDCGDWMSKLSYVAEGFVVAALDCRGQAGASQDSIPVWGNTLNGHIIRGLDDPDPDKLYFRNVFLDTAALARIVMALDMVDDKRVAATGGSQGGALTLAVIGLEPRINRAAAVFPFLCDYKRVWDMDMDERAYAELREHFRHFDPRHERENEIFLKLGYIDLVNLMPRVKTDVLLFTGLMDNICPASTQYAAYNNLPKGITKKHILYPDFGHEDLPGCNDIIIDYLKEM